MTKWTCTVSSNRREFFVTDIDSLHILYFNMKEKSNTFGGYPLTSTSELDIVSEEIDGVVDTNAPGKQDPIRPVNSLQSDSLPSPDQDQNTCNPNIDDSIFTPEQIDHLIAELEHEWSDEIGFHIQKLETNEAIQFVERQNSKKNLMFSHFSSSSPQHNNELDTVSSRKLIHSKETESLDKTNQIPKSPQKSQRNEEKIETKPWKLPKKKRQEYKERMQSISDSKSSDQVYNQKLLCIQMNDNCSNGKNQTIIPRGNFQNEIRNRWNTLSIQNVPPGREESTVKVPISSFVKIGGDGVQKRLGFTPPNNGNCYQHTTNMGVCKKGDIFPSPMIISPRHRPVHQFSREKKKSEGNSKKVDINSQKNCSLRVSLGEPSRNNLFDVKLQFTSASNHEQHIEMQGDGRGGEKTCLRNQIKEFKKKQERDRIRKMIQQSVEHQKKKRGSRESKLFSADERYDTLRMQRIAKRSVELKLSIQARSSNRLEETNRFRRPFKEIKFKISNRPCRPSNSKIKNIIDPSTDEDKENKNPNTRPDNIHAVGDNRRKIGMARFFKQKHPKMTSPSKDGLKYCALSASHSYKTMQQSKQKKRDKLNKIRHSSPSVTKDLLLDWNISNQKNPSCPTAYNKNRSVG